MFNYLADRLNVKQIGEMLAPTLTPEQELHAAIEGGLEDKFLRLLDEQHVDVNARTDAGSLPIHTAAYHGRVSMVEELLSRQVHVDAIGPRGSTPMHLAASQGHENVVRLLVNSGGNPAARNRNNSTPYDVAKGGSLRQYLLPLQFQHEDPNQAASMIPAGITPSIDPNAPRPDIAPPPTADMVMQQQTEVPPPPAAHSSLYAASSHSAIPRGGNYSRFAKSSYRPIQADGFGTSVGNEELTAKYGNTREVKKTAPPPAAMGPGPTGESAPVGGNPYSGASRFQAYGQTQRGSDVSGQPARGPPQFKIFNPKAAAAGGAGVAPPPVGMNQPPPPAMGSMPPPAPQSVELETPSEHVHLSSTSSNFQ